MTGFVWFVVCLLIIGLVLRAIWRRRVQLISVRGTGVRADIGGLHDVPRARVRDLAIVGVDVARVVLAFGDTGSTEAGPPVETTILVSLGERDAGFAILRGWYEAGSVLGVVIPPSRRSSGCAASTTYSRSPSAVSTSEAANPNRPRPGVSQKPAGPATNAGGPVRARLSPLE